MNKGFVYVLANSAMPGLFKVGRTERDVEERARELSTATGLPVPFIIVYEQGFDDCLAAEAFVHAYLEVRGYRTTNNREFFNAPCVEIIKALSAYALTSVATVSTDDKVETVVGALIRFHVELGRLPLRDEVDHEIVKQISTFVDAAKGTPNNREMDVIIVSAIGVFAVALGAAFSQFDAPQSEVVRRFLTFSASLKDIPLSENAVYDELVVDQSTPDSDDPLLPYRSEPWFDVIEQSERVYEGETDMPGNYADGLRLYRQAARLGSLSAFAAIARIYEYGRGAIASDRKQMHWLNEGAKRGCMVCYWRMSLLFVKQGDMLNAERSLTQFRLDLDGRDRAAGQRADIVWRHMWGVYQDCVTCLFRKFRWNIEYKSIYEPLFTKIAMQIKDAARARIEGTVVVEDRAALSRVVEYLDRLQKQMDK